MTEASVMERRASLRLKSIPESKRPHYGPCSPINLLVPCLKITSARKPRKINSVPNVPLNMIEGLDEPNLENKPESGCCNGTAQMTPQLEEKAKIRYSNGAAQMSIGDKGDHARVKHTLQVYNSHYLHFVQKHQKDTAQGVAQGVKRKMKADKEILYPRKKIGNLPGVDVGFQFYSRAEMVAIGFHAHWLNGIDFMGMEYSKLEYKGYKFPLAVSVVISGQYEDDVDNLEDVWYTGQGGNDLLASKQQYKDQILSSGNLALKVVECLSEKGVSGFIIYKFRLKRDPDQPKLTSDQVHFARAHKPYTSSKFPGLVSFDIAAGQEGMHIRAINTIDYTAPTGFTYTNSIQVAEGITLPANAEGCKCEGNCTDEKSCACARLNGNEFPYVPCNGDRLIRPKDAVYECGPNCGCGPGCINRISQRKLKYKLEIFRTQEKGWAVRSGHFIPSGAPVCEYLGVLRKTNDMDTVTGNDYIFEIDFQHTIKGIGRRQRRSIDASEPTSAQANIDDKALDDNSPEYCVDAGSVGNVARFINHSCRPNLFVQCVLSSHHDLEFARIVLVTYENISPCEELTYDYGYALDSVAGPDGRVKKLPCHCGAADCRKRLY